MTTARIKDPSIETLRGIAIILVVAGYIIRFDTNALPDSFAASWLRLSDVLLSYIRLPLFTVISGYLYAESPVTKETFPKLLAGKNRRVLIPFLVFSAIQFLILSFIPGSGDSLRDIWKIYVIPSQQMWFLLSIFLIFVMVGMLDAFKALNTWRNFLLVLVLSMALHVWFNMTEILSISGVNFLMPFFLIGYGLRRYADRFLSASTVRACLIIFVLTFALKPVLYHYGVSLSTRSYRMLGLIVATSAMPLLFHYRRSIPALASIGFYSFGIYLFHRVTVTAVRLTLGPHLNGNPFLIFVLYLAGGIALALLVQVILERNNWSRVYILGLKKEDRAG